MQCVTRLCPMQILGKQAGNTAYKTKACLRMLSLEADLDVARHAIRSLLSDMGTESGMWTVPLLSEHIDSSDSDLPLLFPFSLPLADFDHMLHHTMLECEDGFMANNPHWTNFDSSLHAISKYFSKRDCCDRYVEKQINKNQSIPQGVKKGLASMFSATCPTYCKTRWHFAYDVCHWISRRQQLIEYLETQT